MLLTVAMAISFIPATIMADDDAQNVTISIEGKSAGSDTESSDSDVLFAGYVNRQFGIEDETTAPVTRGTKSRSAAPSNMGSQLTGNDKVVYDTVVSALQEIVAGTRTSTEITLFGGTYSCTLDQIGASSWNDEDAIYQALDYCVGYDLEKVFPALLYDHPYEMFWCDKVRGVEVPASSISYFLQGDAVYFQDYSEILQFRVLPDYSATHEANTFELGNIVNVVNTAATNAQSIVDGASALSDRDKLAAYKQAICDLTSYNNAAGTAGGSIAYGNGNPWQLIWVFDGDPETEVVCEGYSKAFKYLCDQSDFASDRIDCYLVEGTMVGGTGAGAHMWNMVTLEDGKHYLVDVTNCDGDPGNTVNSIGYPDKLFLRTYDEKETVNKTENNTAYETTQYTYYINASNQITYWYGLNTEKLYSDELLTVAGSEGDFDKLDVTIKHSCTFDNSLAINYYVETAELSGYSDIKLVLKKYGETIELPARKKIVDGTTYYWVQYTGIAAHEMGMMLNAEIRATKGGEEYASEVDCYSVKTYAYNMLQKNGYPAKFYTLLVDMLNFGAAAQLYKDGNTATDLVNADLTSEQQSMATQSDPVLPQEGGMIYIGTPSDPVLFSGLSVSLSSSLAVNYYMTISASQSTTNLKLVCTYTSSYGEQITKNIPFSEFRNAGGEYVASLQSVAAADARCKITVQVYDGDTPVSGTFTSSIADYAKSDLDNDANEATIIYSMMKYCDAAHAFFNE